MPIHIIAQGFFDGLDAIPFGWAAVKLIPALAVIYLLKLYFNGVSCKSERNMHSKVVMITGGTSGIGAEVVKGLATRGAQIILLTQHPLSDPFLVDYIMDLRDQTGNQLITAEHVDLTSLHSIRKFATKWVDNAPPRRLDMIILCANVRTPPGGKSATTEDGLETTWAVNYMANFHLLSILSPALRAQPPDRDVRVIFGTCSSYMGGILPTIDGKSDSKAKAEDKNKTAVKEKAGKKQKPQHLTPAGSYSASKLALMTFALAFQKHLSSYTRPDKNPVNARVIVVDPGWSRTPGMRRYLSCGSLWGLFLYLAMWPFWWLVLKSPDMGAQTFLYAAMEAQYGRGEGGKFLKECRERTFVKSEITDEGVQGKLWKFSETTVQVLEKKGAVRRAEEKKREEERKKKEEEEEEEKKKNNNEENGKGKAESGKAEKRAGKK